MQTDVDSLLKRARKQGYIIVAPRRRRRQRADPHAALIATYCSRLRLAPGEARALAALMQGDVVDRQKLHAAISSNPLAVPQLVDVTISRLRVKLRKRLPDVKITCAYKYGYRLDPDSRDKI